MDLGWGRSSASLGELMGNSVRNEATDGKHRSHILWAMQAL